MRDGDGGAMSGTDPELGAGLRTLVDTQPVDADRAFRAITEGTASPRRSVPIGLGVLAAAAVAVVVVAVSVTTPPSRSSPPLKLVGDAEAAVVVRIDTGGDQPTAALTVGNKTVSAAELKGTPTEGGLSLDASDPEPFSGAPSVNVPDGSSLLVEGTFDSASASAITWLTLEPNGQGSVRITDIGWQLNSSGGSVVFDGDGDRVPLVVEATIGSVPHYFLFLTQVVQAKA
jgi:hypothetical protein